MTASFLLAQHPPINSEDIRQNSSFPFPGFVFSHVFAIIIPPPHPILTCSNEERLSSPRCFDFRPPEEISIYGQGKRRGSSSEREEWMKHKLFFSF